MRLLVVTQKVDSEDPNLGFFHAWLLALAGRFDRLTVICLEKGVHHLPHNIEVLSLGKEDGEGHFGYLVRFYRFIFRRHRTYDHVFVHMNPEYVILGGWWWRLTGKRVLFWYTHKAVNLRLRCATMFAHKIFTASPESFRLKTKKIEAVGHGIDISSIPLSRITRPNALLFVGRISPVKDLETVILALQEIFRQNPLLEFSLDIVGDPVTAADQAYKEAVQKLLETLHLSHKVQFLGSVPHRDMPLVYANHGVLIHTSRTGSMDKVVLEALASGLSVLTSSEAYHRLGDIVTAFDANRPEALAEAILTHLNREVIGPNMPGRKFVEDRHALAHVVDRIVDYFRGEQ